MMMRIVYYCCIVNRCFIFQMLSKKVSGNDKKAGVSLLRFVISRKIRRRRPSVASRRSIHSTQFSTQTWFPLNMIFRESVIYRRNIRLFCSVPTTRFFATESDNKHGSYERDPLWYSPILRMQNPLSRGVSTVCIEDER